MALYDVDSAQPQPQRTTEDSRDCDVRQRRGRRVGGEEGESCTGMKQAGYAYVGPSSLSSAEDQQTNHIRQLLKKF
jgi:hypothetical protein